MSEKPQQDWQALGKAVVARRVDLGYETREKFAHAAAMSSRLLADIENGKRDHYGPATLVRLERALKWRTGSAESILEGRDATDSPDEAQRSFHPGQISLNIAVNIRRLRNLRSWSVAKLAQECETAGYPQLTASSLGNIERGQDPDAKRQPREVTAEELFVFADLFQVPIDTLVGRAPCPVCEDRPPTGFTCNACGTGATGGASQ